MNVRNRILGIPRVHLAPRASVMATSYTEIVAILEVKNVQYQVFQTLAYPIGEPRCLFHDPSAMSTCHTNIPKPEVFFINCELFPGMVRTLRC